MSTLLGNEEEQGNVNMAKKKATYKINGRISSLREIRSIAKHDSVHDALGDYISSGEAYKAGISYNTLRKWRINGKLKSKKMKQTWYYSRDDLLNLIKTS